jgi:hypothetical protein
MTKRLKQWCGRAETSVKRLQCCGFQCAGKAMRQVYQCWWRICREINVFFSRFKYHTFYILYPYIHLWPVYWLSFVNEIAQIHEQSQYIFNVVFYETRSCGKNKKLWEKLTTFLSLHIEHLTSYRLHRKHHVQQFFYWTMCICCQRMCLPSIAQQHIGGGAGHKESKVI